MTTLDHRLVRPHDVEVLSAPAGSAVAAEVVRVQRVGFEVRAVMQTSSATTTTAQLTRAQSESMRPAPGGKVWLRAAPNSTSLPVAG